MISGYVDISEIIYEACERLAISNSEAYEMRFLRLALDAELKIGTGMIVARRVILYQVGSSSFNGKTLKVPHDLIDGLTILDSNKSVFCSEKYSIRGKNIYFCETQTEPVILIYNGIEFDVNDEPVISYNHKEAVVSYIVYMEMFSRRSAKKATEYVFQDSRGWWQDRLGEARGDDAFPSSAEIKRAAAELSSIHMCLKNGNLKCDCETVDELVDGFDKLFKVFYGVLPLSSNLDVGVDYTDTILDNETETTTAELSSGDFVLSTNIVGRFVLVVPYESGTINSMKDAFGGDIFDGYFNIIQDEVRQLTIYVAKNFVMASDYKLTFKFSK